MELRRLSRFLSFHIGRGVGEQGTYGRVRGVLSILFCIFRFRWSCIDFIVLGRLGPSTGSLTLRFFSDQGKQAWY